MSSRARVFGFGIGDKEGWKRLEDELGSVGAEIKGVFDRIGDKFKFVVSRQTSRKASRRWPVRSASTS